MKSFEIEVTTKIQVLANGKNEAEAKVRKVFADVWPNAEVKTEVKESK